MKREWGDLALIRGVIGTYGERGSQIISGELETETLKGR